MDGGGRMEKGEERRADKGGGGQGVGGSEDRGRVCDCKSFFILMSSLLTKKEKAVINRTLRKPNPT
jgi:hypothetical protein